MKTIFETADWFLSASVLQHHRQYWGKSLAILLWWIVVKVPTTVVHSKFAFISYLPASPLLFNCTSAHPPLKILSGWIQGGTGTRSHPVYSWFRLLQRCAAWHSSRGLWQVQGACSFLSLFLSFLFISPTGDVSKSSTKTELTLR